MLPLALMVVFALSRIPGMLPQNFSAAYALVFCAGVYFTGRMAWWLPLTTLLMSGNACRILPPTPLRQSEVRRARARPSSCRQRSPGVAADGGKSSFHCRDGTPEPGHRCGRRPPLIAVNITTPSSQRKLAVMRRCHLEFDLRKFNETDRQRAEL